MAISVLPPIAFTIAEKNDIQLLTVVLQNLIHQLNEAGLVPLADRLLSTDSVDSINHTIIDASDRIDAIINPSSS